MISCFALFFDMFLNNFGVYLDDEVIFGVIFLNARSGASYSVVLFVECSSFANMSRAAYLITIPVGDVTTAEIPTPLWHQAPSHYTTQGVSISSPGL
jgi:hypothetical protein